MNNYHKQGYEYAKGATSYILALLLALTVIFAGVKMIFGLFGWGIDDSDRDAFHRSGLRVHVDAKTGIEYLSDGNGGLVRRDFRQP